MANMNGREKRQYKRFESLNLSYVCVDENDVLVNEGMGRTLNISQSGILLETHFKMEFNHYVILSMALGDELVDVRGKVVHCGVGKDNAYQTGVQFVNIDENAELLLKKYIDFFKEQQLLESCEGETGR